MDLIGLFSLTQIVALGFAGLVGVAALSDLRDFRIPNWVSLALVGLFFVHLTLNPSSVDWLRSIALGIGVFIAGAILFQKGLIGGGDIKLLAAIALWAGPDRILRVILIIAVVGGILSLYKLIRIYLSRRKEGLRGLRAQMAGSPVPYAVAIAAGALIGIFPTLSS